MMGGFDVDSLQLGGWAISAQSAFDPLEHSLYQGDGQRRRGDLYPVVLETIAGGADGTQYSGDGSPATQAVVAYPRGIAFAPDGTIYVADLKKNSTDRSQRDHHHLCGDALRTARDVQ